MTARARELTNSILEVIDFSDDDGVPLGKMEECLMKAISFRELITIVNILAHHGLITIDANHVARRVRT